MIEAIRTTRGSEKWAFALAVTLWLGCSGQELAVGDFVPFDAASEDASIRGGKDRQAPTVPTGLSETLVSCTQTNLAWNASTDIGNSGLSGYRLYRNGAFVQQVTSTSASESGLSPSTSYQYAVSAFDRAGNESAKSGSILVNMPSCPPPPANAPPVAHAGADQTAVSLTAVTFDGSASTDSDGTLVSYSWSFGDGVAGSGVSVSHSYAAPGTFNVTLTVQDNSGSTASDSALVVVSAPPPNMAPVANAGPDQTSLSLNPVGFSSAGSSDPDGSIVSFAWNFGDGATASGATASHSFAAPGIYTVTLTVTDNGGLTGRDTTVVTVTNRAPVANAGPDKTAASGTVLSLTGSGSDADGTVVGFLWTFGDGTTSNGASVSHTYAAAGTYVATLTVTDNSGTTASDTATIVVTAPAPVVTQPNDPKFRMQWAFAAMRMVEAWAATSSTTQVTVAIIDTGIRRDPDLQGHIGIGVNLLDGGSTDDGYGSYGVGTQEASIIGALTNNGAGMAGIARNVRMLPVKICDAWCSSTETVLGNLLASGIDWSVQNGAQIVLTGLALSISTPNLNNAVANAASRGVLIVAPSGNVVGPVRYPAALAGTIAVGGSTPADTPVSYSSFGPELDLVAPSVNTVIGTGGCCFLRAGVNLAAANVAGALALLIAEGVPAAQAPGFLYQGAADTGTPGWDSSTGWGRLNVCGALQAAGKSCPTFQDTQAPTNPSNLTITASGTAPNAYLRLQWTESFDNIGIVGYDLYRDGVKVDRVFSPETSTFAFPEMYNPGAQDLTVNGLSPSTRYCYQVVAVDAAGNRSASSNVACATTNP